MRSIVISLVLFLVYFAVDLFLPFKGMLNFAPLIIASLALGLLSAKWNWTRVLIFLTLVIIVITMSLVVGGYSDINAAAIDNPEVKSRWVKQLALGNLNVVFLVLISSFLGWRLGNVFRGLRSKNL